MESSGGETTAHSADLGFGFALFVQCNYKWCPPVVPYNIGQWPFQQPKRPRAIIVDCPTAARRRDFQFTVVCYSAMVVYGSVYVTVRPENCSSYQGETHFHTKRLRRLLKSKKPFGEGWDAFVSNYNHHLCCYWFWASYVLDQPCNPSSAFRLIGGQACALCKTVSNKVTCKHKQGFVSDLLDI